MCVGLPPQPGRTEASGRARPDSGDTRPGFPVCLGGRSEGRSGWFLRGPGAEMWVLTATLSYAFSCLVSVYRLPQLRPLQRAPRMKITCMSSVSQGTAPAQKPLGPVPYLVSCYGCCPQRTSGVSGLRSILQKGSGLMPHTIRAGPWDLAPGSRWLL